MNELLNCTSAITKRTILTKSHSASVQAASTASSTNEVLPQSTRITLSGKKELDAKGMKFEVLYEKLIRRP